jgi:hypothetical protein
LTWKNGKWKMENEIWKISKNETTKMAKMQQAFKSRMEPVLVTRALTGCFVVLLAWYSS